MNELALARLLQLASQALPIGGYSHSQGMESAIEQGVVTDETTACNWISDVFDYSLVTFELPLLRAMDLAWADGRFADLRALNEEFLATREAKELRAATVQMGYSLRTLLSVLPDMPADIVTMLLALEDPSLPCAWSAAAAAWQLPSSASALAYAWSWAENQVLVAIKTVPLGQSTGQRVLQALGSRMARAIAGMPPCDGRNGAPDAKEMHSNFAPALAIHSSQHETQYSRLFRS